MSPIVRTNTGAPSTRPIQKRRVMSTSSGLGASDRSATRGSSAIPHFGQAPGRSLRTSGSIGQTYSVDGGRSTFDVRGSSFGVRRSTFDVRGSTFDVRFKPPMVSSAGAGVGMDSRVPDRYFFGSDVNLATQPFKQK
jgi:hypothetical protein